MANTEKATAKQIEAIMGELSVEDRKVLQDHLKGGKSRRVGEAELKAKYPQMVEGSLAFDDVRNKQFVFINCAHPGCGETRKTFTSDLFQVSMCDSHRKEAAKAKRDAKAARIKEILAQAASK